MDMSKNKSRKMKRYADQEKYFAFLLYLFNRSTAIEFDLKEKVDENGKVLKEAKHVWSSFYNQIDYSLLRRDRNLTKDFVEFVKDSEYKKDTRLYLSDEDREAAAQRRAEEVACEIEQFIHRMNKN
jgi:uncharacterized membrane protein